MTRINLTNALIIFIVFFSLFTRFYGLNWDANFHLHPDERFLTMVTSAISFPRHLGEIFSTADSSLNPNNVGFSFYVYGTLPIFMVKVLSVILSLDNYFDITLLGRTVSGILDLLTLYVVYLISFRVFKDKLTAVLSAFFYSALIIPIQLSHFYTVDTHLTFLLTLTYLLLLSVMRQERFSPQTAVSLGLAFGGALAAKYSAVLFFPVIFLGLSVNYFRRRDISLLLKNSLIIFSCIFLSFRFFQPFFFSGVLSINSEVISSLKTLKSFDDYSGWYPPAVQWIKAPKLIFPGLNLFWWGVGPVLSFVGIFSLLTFLRRIKLFPDIFPAFLWVIGLFFYHGLGFSMTGRYFYPLLPLLAVFSGFGLSRIFNFNRWVFLFIFISSLILPLAFVSIYLHPHTRVRASDWINSHLPAGSVLSCDEWDDCLPLGDASAYQQVQLPMFLPDISSKQVEINSKLSQIQYLVISSNRIYGAVSMASDKYPWTSDFYRRLFAGQTQFELIASFVSRPRLLIPGIKVCLTPPSINYGFVASSAVKCSDPGISFVDDYAEEAYTVYDHPSVFIFRNKLLTSH
jgi:hypothetical protein